MLVSCWKFGQIFVKMHLCYQQQEEEKGQDKKEGVGDGNLSMGGKGWWVKKIGLDGNLSGGGVVVGKLGPAVRHSGHYC